MRAIPAIALLAAVSALASSPVALPDTASVRSKSGQFVVYAGRLPPAPPAPPNLVTNVDYAELEASLVAVSCERIKQALWTELELSGQWSGKVHLTLLPVQGEDDPVTIVSERFPKGWGYRVELPQFVRRERFVRAIVQTLLLERANRQGPVRSADIPFWLTEGLTRHLLGSHPSELILTNPRWKLRGLELNPVVLDERRRDPLELAREELRQSPALSLEKLSWPGAEDLTGDAGEVFGSSAQLFAGELLRLPGGRACFRTLLDELAACYNWQTAFFRAFQTHFTRQLDLEKWWELQLVHLTGRDAHELWTLEESWRKLDEILRAPVEVRRATNDLPARAEVPLQAVIREWDSARQIPLLKSKLRDLELARLRVAPELAGLVEEYHQVLVKLTRRLEQPDLVLPVAKIDPPRLKPPTRDTLKQLDELDARRNAMRPASNPPSQDRPEDKASLMVRFPDPPPPSPALRIP